LKKRLRAGQLQGKSGALRLIERECALFDGGRKNGLKGKTARVSLWRKWVGGFQQGVVVKRRKLAYQLRELGRSCLVRCASTKTETTEQHTKLKKVSMWEFEGQ